MIIELGRPTTGVLLSDAEKITHTLIDDCDRQICVGSLSIAEAAQKLAKPCPCRIFNAKRL